MRKVRQAEVLLWVQQNSLRLVSGRLCVATPPSFTELTFPAVPTSWKVKSQGKRSKVNQSLSAQQAQGYLITATSFQNQLYFSIMLWVCPFVLNFANVIIQQCPIRAALRESPYSSVQSQQGLERVHTAVSNQSRAWTQPILVCPIRSGFGDSPYSCVQSEQGLETGLRLWGSSESMGP